jgi:hypothetical protein
MHLALKENNGLNKEKSLWTVAVVQLLEQPLYICKWRPLIQPVVCTGVKTVRNVE